MGGIEMSHFPFSAVVGNDDLKLALLLCAIDPAIGGVLARGDKGSAKTTLARALAAILPNEAPFTELPLGTTEDRLIGNLDIAAAFEGKGANFQPGLLAAAHGGVLYVDEVNLLSDHLVDVLLDVAASGVNKVERDGISHQHLARFVLVGSMNPEEGDLRPQLLDRFGLAVDVVTASDVEVRTEALRRRLAFDEDPEGFAANWAKEQTALSTRLAQVKPAEIGDDLLEVITSLCSSVGAEGLRADLVIARAARALAGWEGRDVASAQDVRRVAPMALAHRQRRSPFDPGGINEDRLNQALDDALNDLAEDSVEGSSADGSFDDDGNADGSAHGDGSQQTLNIASAAPNAIVHLQASREVGGDASGRRSMSIGERGRLIGSRIPDGPISSIATGATMLAAANRHVGDLAAATSSIPTIERHDIREAVRETKTSNLVILVLDASGSMGFERRSQVALGALSGVLLDAYQRRDKVAVVTFRNDSAEVTLRPTSSIEVARARLATVATGGRTPLAAGLQTTLELASSTSNEYRPLIVLITDGRATATPSEVDPLQAAIDAATTIRNRRIDSVVVDAEEGTTRLGLAFDIAKAMGARFLTLDELSLTTLKEFLPR